MHHDWPGYMAWNYQSEKSKNLISFQYTSMIYYVLQPMALKSWSLSCVMVGYSGRIPIYLSQSRGKHSKRESNCYLGALHSMAPPCSLSFLPVLRRIERHITLGIKVSESNLIHSLRIPKSRSFPHLIYYQICLPTEREHQEQW